MDGALSIPRKPRFRDAVEAVVGDGEAELSLAGRVCGFEFGPGDTAGVARLFADLEAGGRGVEELIARSPEIGEQIPALLRDFDRLRLLTESEPPSTDGVRSGLQLYREVRRLADRQIERNARSSFTTALREGRATRRQMVGYALEYFWIVKTAPALIGPALSTAHTAGERALIQDFLRSELGHDRFLGRALEAAEVSPEEMEAHQPLPATFALCASLGVYARQHPLSFKACLFLFERAQPAFIDAFDARCRALGLPAAFHEPLRAHADINEDYDHEDISRALMAFDEAIAPEACTVVKRHVALMVETMVQQEEQILAWYGQGRGRVARIFS